MAWQFTYWGEVMWSKGCSGEMEHCMGKHGSQNKAWNVHELEPRVSMGEWQEMTVDR